ncbi:hypothetical protein PF003_g22855 [Phytophthora fragariae]|nr:hypothetical protein PF003_g22855 [Phytophthora fragariae]
MSPNTLPPAFESPDPTCKSMSPAAPFVAPDVTMLTAPELPATDTPVDNEVNPLTCAPPVDNAILPLVRAVPSLGSECSSYEMKRPGKACVM